MIVRKQIIGAHAVVLLEQARVVPVPRRHAGARPEQEAGGDPRVLHVVAEGGEEEGQALLAAEPVEQAGRGGQAEDGLRSVRGVGLSRCPISMLYSFLHSFHSKTYNAECR